MDAPTTQPENYTKVAEAYFEEFLGKGWFAKILAQVSTWVVSAVIGILGWVVELFDVLLAAVVTVFDKVEGTQSPAFIQLVAALMSDLLNITITPEQIQRGQEHGGDAGQREAVGTALISAWIRDYTTKAGASGDSSTGESFGDVPSLPMGGERGALNGSQSARRLVGRMTQTAVEDGNISMLTEMMSLGFIENASKYGDALARNLGFSRLAARALAPIYQLLIAEPLKTELQYHHRPNHPGVAAAIKHFFAQALTREQLYILAGREGYSNAWTDVMIDQARPDFSAGDIARMWKWRTIDQAKATELLKLRGWGDNDAITEANLMQLTDQEGAAGSYVSTIASLASNRQIPTDQLEKLLAVAPENTGTIDWTRKRIALALEYNLKELSWSEVQEAYLEALIDQDDVDEWLRNEGYSPFAIKVKRLALLSKASDQIATDVAKAKAASDKKKADEAKAALEARQKAALGGVSGGVEPAFADYGNAYVAGHFTDTQFSDFLTRYGFAGPGLALEFGKWNDKRVAHDAAVSKAGQIQGSAPQTSLTLSQVEAAYTNGVIERIDLDGWLHSHGYTPGDAAILLADADIAAAAHDARVADGTGGSPGAPKPKLSVSQGEAAYSGGVWTRDQLAGLLADLDYSNAEASVVLRLADVKREGAQTAAAAALAVRNAVPDARLSLAQITAAFIAHEATLAQFTQWLVDAHYDGSERALLIADATRKQSAADDAATAAADRADAAAVRPLTFSQAEAAYLAGKIDAAALRAFLTSQHYSAYDVDLLMSLAAAKRSTAPTTTPGTVPAGTTPHVRLLSIPQLNKAYMDGTIDLTRVQAGYQDLGYGTADIAILTQSLLIQDAAKNPAPPDDTTEP